MEELILHIAPTAGQYGKILPSTLSNTGELDFNIILFSNCVFLQVLLHDLVMLLFNDQQCLYFKILLTQDI